MYRLCFSVTAKSRSEGRCVCLAIMKRCWIFLYTLTLTKWSQKLINQLLFWSLQFSVYTMSSSEFDGFSVKCLYITHYFFWASFNLVSIRAINTNSFNHWYSHELQGCLSEPFVNKMHHRLLGTALGALVEDQMR